MYRHSSQVNCLVKPSLPSPEHTSDSEPDFVEALDRKRRQLDAEVSNFKAVKDIEFREFEKDLRTRKKRGRGSSTSSETSPSKASGAASTAAVLSLLASAHNGSANGWNGYKSKKGCEGIGEKILRPAPLSKPTLSLDKLTITGETTPPISGLGTPPTPSILTRSIARSPSTASTKSTPPRSNPEKPAQAPPTPTSERSDAFTGVFLPTYLPLLESRDHTPTVRSPQPLTPQEDEKKQLQQHIKVDSMNQEAAPEERQDTTTIIIPPKSHSLPQQSISPTVVVPTKRTHSTPQLPSTNRPSALRNSSGSRKAANGSVEGSSVRKRKHVTFQLADSAIVDPSSSYEELPSPEPRSANADVADAIDFLVDGDTERTKSNGNGSLSTDATMRNGSPAEQQQQQQQQGRKNNNGNNNNLSPRDTTQRRGRRLRSPAVSPLPSPSPSPTIPGLVESPDESGFSGGFVASDDGGSGVGFFELDEELASPAFAEDRAFEFSGGEIGETEENKIDDLLLMDDEKKAGAFGDGDGLGIGDGGVEEVQVGSFAAGSVPIDIVRPSGMGSWVGGSQPR